MADIVDRETRSRMMAAVKGKNTKPEIAVRRALHAMGFRFRLHKAGLPGRPDIVLPKHKVAIFVNGCFWHGHDCPMYRQPANNRAFWIVKIDRNRERDARAMSEIKQVGWRVLTIWECAMRGRGRIGIDALIIRTARWIAGPRKAGSIRGGT
ncbi:MAG: DNA mismatch endonuclease Vsr [Alphaproteobacteria bacterium]|nr:DNA mismatch endonuclease Vsr [Alphaproteobacteria bacterium]